MGFTGEDTHIVTMAAGLEIGERRSSVKFEMSVTVANNVN